MSQYSLIGFNSSNSGVYEACVYCLNDDKELYAVSDNTVIPLPPKKYRKAQLDWPDGCLAECGDYAVAYRNADYEISLVLLAGKCTKECPIFPICPLVAREGLFYDGARLVQITVLPKVITRGN